MSSKFWAVKYLPNWLKLTLLALELLFILILFGFVWGLWNKTVFVKNELAGVDKAQEQIQILADLGRYRGACTAVLINPQTSLREVCIDTRRTLLSLDHNGSVPDITEPRVGESGFNPKDFFIERTALNLAKRDDLRTLRASSNVMLDPEPDTYLLGEMYFFTLPNIIEGIGRLRGVLALTPDYPELLILRDKTLGVVEEYLNLQQRNLNYLGDYLLGLDAAIFQSANEGRLQLSEYVTAAEQIVSLDGSGDMDYLRLSQTLFADGTALIESFVILSEEVGGSLTRRLSDRYKNLVGMIQLTLFLGLVFQGLLLLTTFRIGRTYLSVQSARDGSVALSKELARTIDDRERMFSIIGHELRTPAAALKMMIDDRIVSKNSGVSLESLQEVSQHLLDVLDDMRVTSDSDLATSEKASQQICVAAIVSNTIESLSRFAEKRHFSIALETDENASRLSRGPRQLIRQIITNLVKNAIIHSGGSKVSVSLKGTLIDPETMRYQLSVCDNGTGIPQESLARLFEPFERGNTSEDGSGLGLHVCRELAVSLKSGDLRYEKSCDGGACFILDFELPLAVDEMTQSVSNPKRSSLSGKRILFVEDTEMLRMLGVKMLERIGAVVTPAIHGKEALGLFSVDKFDLVVTDIFMPEMDGYSLTKKLRERGYSGPIIGLTGATVGDEASRLVNQGANGVLGKPLSIQALEEIIKIDKV